MPAARPAFETLTLALLAATYGLWGLGTTVVFAWSPAVGVVLTAITIAQFSSLQHEALHGHPCRTAWLNAALVFPALTLFIPYGRFKTTHLAHHHDPILTDPYDDPESNYLDPARWARLPAAARWLLRANNTLLGRMVIGPPLSCVSFALADLALIRAGDRGVLRDWLLHLAGVALVVAWVWPAPISAVAYLAAVWGGLALVKIRTFLEHRAHSLARARTVIIEDRGPLALLFLNNNLHGVHHCHPEVAWYDLPRLYAANRAHYLARNEGYRYRSYFDIIRRHLLTAKDPVPHPLYRSPEPD